MLIDSEDSALTAIDLCLSRSLQSFELSGWPTASIRLVTNEQPGLYSDELQGFLELQRAIDEQHARFQGSYSPQYATRRNGVRLYYEISKGSVNVDISLAETLKVFLEHMTTLGELSPVQFANVLIWGLLGTSPIFYLIRSSIRKKEIAAELELEKEKLKVFERVCEHISSDSDLKFVEDRMNGAFAVLFRKLRKGEAYLNGTLIDDHFRASISQHESRLSGNKLSGRFVIQDISKKEKQRYQITIQSIETKQSFRVLINMELYQKALFQQLQEHKQKQRTFWAEIAIQDEDAKKSTATFSRLFNENGFINKYISRSCGKA